jgi:hypothetical protein
MNILWFKLPERESRNLVIAYFSFNRPLNKTHYVELCASKDV